MSVEVDGFNPGFSCLNGEDANKWSIRCCPPVNASTSGALDSDGGMGCPLICVDYVKNSRVLGIPKSETLKFINFGKGELSRVSAIHSGDCVLGVLDDPLVSVEHI